MADVPIRSVLVVSEDPDIREVTSFGFPDDFEVIVVADAREAFQVARSRTPALVIADLHSGSAGGYSLALELKQAIGLENVPLVMVLEREQDEWLARQAGATVIRVKPVDTAVLVQDALSLVTDSQTT
jgi:DNA-binding response OmpR family regulator